MERKNNYLNRKLFFIISTLLISGIFLISCNGKKKQAAENEITTDTTKANFGQTTAPLVGVKFPGFIIQYDALDKLPKGIITDKPKLLLKVGFADITDLKTMMLVPYFSKTHGHYAEDATPLSNLVTPGTKESEEFMNNVIFGNNDVVLKRLLRKNGAKRDCDYFEFVPMKKQFAGDPTYHLAFKIYAVKLDAQKIKILTEEEIAGGSNPTPPGRPSAD